MLQTINSEFDPDSILLLMKPEGYDYKDEKNLMKTGIREERVMERWRNRIKRLSFKQYFLIAGGIIVLLIVAGSIVKVQWKEIMECCNRVEIDGKILPMLPEYKENVKK